MPSLQAWKAVTVGCPCDYSGLSYAKLTGGSGIQWPCTPETAPDGTERLYTDGEFPTYEHNCESYGHDLDTGELACAMPCDACSIMYTVVFTLFRSQVPPSLRWSTPSCVRPARPSSKGQPTARPLRRRMGSTRCGCLQVRLNDLLYAISSKLEPSIVPVDHSGL